MSSIKTKKTVWWGRHGEGFHNLKDPPEIYEGAETRLTPEGERQADRIAERAQKLPIDLVISSTMKRARQTGFRVAEVTGKPIIYNDLFVEILLPSAMDGKVWRDPETQRIHEDWKAALYTPRRVLDGENCSAGLVRGYQALELLEDRPEENIFVSSHGLFSRTVAGIIMLGEHVSVGALRTMEHSLRTTNTGLTIFEYDPDGVHVKWSMLTWNDFAHL